jgi:hypothetical protein
LTVKLFLTTLQLPFFDPELDAIFFDTKRLPQRKREALKRIIKPIIEEIENYEGDD